MTFGNLLSLPRLWKGGWGSGYERSSSADESISRESEDYQLKSRWGLDRALEPNHVTRFPVTSGSKQKERSDGYQLNDAFLCQWPKGGLETAK